MTELFIDGTSVVLEKNFSVQVKRENSFVTKNGEYTYDITLPLTNPINAELYKNINRLNSLQGLEAKRSAILIADNRVYCNGTEVITGWTDDSVSIQIASGNSELNYFIGSDLMISFLKMRETVPQKGDMNYIIKCYPEVDYCLAPMFNSATSHYINKWGVRKNGSECTVVADDEYWFPLPYLCAYIKDLLRALGYDLTLNQLENSVFKDVFICSEVETCKWNEMLPGWSVKDFMEEVEKLYSAVFVVNNRARTVKLMMSTSYYTGVKSVHVLNVKDVYEVEVEELEQDTHMSANVKYKFPDTAFWRWRCLSDNIIKSAKKDTIPADFVPEGYFFGTRISGWFQDENHRKADTIYTDLKDGRQYLFEKNFGNIGPIYRMLNEFAALEREGAEVTIELEMMPVELEAVTFSYEGIAVGTNVQIWLPVVGEGGSSSEDEVTEPTLAEKIENNTQQEEGVKSAISLAFYTGLVHALTKLEFKLLYPIPYIDEYMEQRYGTVGPSEYFMTNTNGASLRLVTLDKLLYQGGYDIDYSKGVKIEAYDPNVYDPNSIFEIRNKRYICKEMEFTLDANGRKGAWTGTFYPISISDTEADARWILSDGKWRDGGVWLDNGRWLDS